MASPDAGVRMNALHQQLEDEDPKSEVIVNRRPISLAEVASLQFGRGEIRLSDSATEHSPASIGHLHRVAVNKGDERAIRDKEIAFVEIAHNVTTGVNGFNNAGYIGGGPE